MPLPAYGGFAVLVSLVACVLLLGTNWSPRRTFAMALVAGALWPVAMALAAGFVLQHLARTLITNRWPDD